MTDTPDVKWRSLTDTAVRYGVSTRTVSRWIAAGRVRTMKSAGGRRLVSVPDGADRPDTTSDSGGHRGGHDDRALTVAATAIERADRLADSQLERADELRRELQATRRSRSSAWGVVAIMAAGAIAGVGFTTSALTRADIETAAMADDLAELGVELQAARAEADDLADELVVQRERWNGQLDRLRADVERLEDQIPPRSVRPDDLSPPASEADGPDVAAIAERHLTPIVELFE